MNLRFVWEFILYGAPWKMVENGERPLKKGSMTVILCNHDWNTVSDAVLFSMCLSSIHDQQLFKNDEKNNFKPFSVKSYHIQFSIAQYKVDCAIHFLISESILDIFFSAPHLHSNFSLHAPIIYPNNLLRQFNRYPTKLISIDFTFLNIMTSNPQFQIEFTFL